MAAGVILLAFIGLALFLFGRMVYLGWKQRNVSISISDELPWVPEEAAAHVIGQVTPTMQAWRYRLASQGPTTVQFSYTYRPAWLVIPCVLFFPLGLLSLLYKKTADIIFNFVPVEGGTLVSIAGQGSPYVRGDIGATIERLSQSHRGEPAES